MRGCLRMTKLFTCNRMPCVLLGASTSTKSTPLGRGQHAPSSLLPFRACRQGDILVVWKLDRLGRSLKHLLEIIEDLQHRGIGFQCVTGVQFDTTTPHGRFALQLFAAMAEYERALIQERVLAGLAAARARGRKGGRRPKLSPEQQRHALMMAESKIPITEIAKTLQCSRHTVYKALAGLRGQGRPAPILAEAAD